ncbi:MAG: Rieske 2Fe-2S domain-containing protein [bacterium]|nr:Rieske 2Fe-2S domain-containing protein [bacterium]
MKENDLIEVCALADVPAGESRAYSLEGYDIAVFNTGDDVFAVENRCPHMGAPLSEGEIVDHHICCHQHSWIIDLDTGMVLNRDGEYAATYPVTIKDDKIFVQVF